MSGVYIHFPFCHNKCGYCAFNSRPCRDQKSHESWFRAVSREIDTRAQEIGSEGLDTIYLGGGTPSLLDSTHVLNLLEALRATSPAPAPSEVTIEANPESVEAAKARAWREAGFDRVSLGAQSFDPAALRFLERRHRPSQLRKAVGHLRAAGFANVSLDLIVGLPSPHGDVFRRDLDQALALAPEHLSVYLLSAESPARLHGLVESGQTSLPDAELQSEVFLAVHERLCATGYEHYEVSSYARPGRRSRHNSAYWTGAPYVGLGPGAHSLTRTARGLVRSANEPDPERYAARLARGERPVAFEEELTPDMQRGEALMLSLRTSDGLAPDDFGPAAPRLREALATYVRAGLLVQDGARYRPTPEGMLRADGMAAELWEVV